MLNTVLKLYGLEEDARAQPHGSGLINGTWTVTTRNGRYILQRINHEIFKNPEHIAANIQAFGGYLSQQHPEYVFVQPVTALNGEQMVHLPEQGYFRMFPFVNGSHTIDVVSSPEQAYEAARQFGRFTKMLAGFPAEQLHITLPGFHNLPLRYTQFETAVANGNPERMLQSQELIGFLRRHQSIVADFERLRHNPDFIIRVAHHDTKISNVLFDDADKGICVIDLDTVMPGYFISDVGDMMRTYLSPVSEEESDLSKITVRPEYYRAIAEGYLSEMGDVLTQTEKTHFVYAGKFMIYMQALRFLTDHLNNDVYYGAKYEGHNFIRAGNQAALLQRLVEMGAV